jgi:altronate dehydratase small subunit
MTEVRAWDALVVDADDDVAVALRDLAAGESVRVRRQGDIVAIGVRDAIPLGHKFALHDLTPGHAIRKYGEAIGAATREIAAGEHVHVHNLVSLRARKKKK